MKFKVYMLFIYLIGITAMPSVRAVKLHFVNNYELANENSEDKECAIGKFVMSLNFSPVQVVNEIYFVLKNIYSPFDMQKVTSFYEVYFVSLYQNSIWHPPKFLM